MSSPSKYGPSSNKPAYGRAWRAANREKTRAYTSRRTRTGWSKEDFQKAWHKQNGCCDVCQQPMQPTGRGKHAVHADHDHLTERVRGLLCAGCNTGLGFFTDDPRKLKAAAAYIERHLEPLPPAVDPLFERLANTRRLTDFTTPECYQ